MRALAALLALVALAPGIAAADGTLAVSSAWARASTPHATSGAVYLTITDTGAADRLVSASTPVAAEAQLHESRMNGGVMQMRPVAALPVAPGAPAVLAPGGYHLMLTGLKQPLRVGAHFPVTLHFEKAGDVTATVSVQAIGAAAMDATDMSGMTMGTGQHMGGSQGK